MKYVFCSLMFDDVESNIKNSKNPNTVSGHKFQENMLKGLMDNNRDVYVLNIPRVRHYPDYPYKRIKEKDYIFNGRKVGKSIGFNNRFIIAYISQYFSLKKLLERYVKENINEEIILLVFNSHMIQMMNLINIKRRFKNVRICDVIGDLHGKYGMLREKASLKERLVDLYGQLSDKLARNSDYYVFLSKYMNEAYGCKEDQYAVLEGMYNSDKEILNRNESSEKILLYAGTLDVEYDIGHLINAFKMTTDEDFRLYIAGSGNYLKDLKKDLVNDKRIVYLGVLSPDDLASYQMSATALISPRKNNHRYVKYSFPSKTMECLAIGKPYIAHKLDSEPDEYSAYIQYADETDEGLASKITEILSLDEDKRIEIGEKSRSFVLNSKNPRVMCKKIIDLCEDNQNH